MAAIKGRIKAISVSKQRGTCKYNVATAELKAGFGIKGDAHAGAWHRQISLLAEESIEKIRAKRAQVKPGDFAENITTEGIDLRNLVLGSSLRLGSEAEIEITQFGKQCHSRCAILEQIGDCIMPREGVFGKITKSGGIKVGDTIEVLNSNDQSRHTDS